MKGGSFFVVSNCFLSISVNFVTYNPCLSKIRKFNFKSDLYLVAYVFRFKYFCERLLNLVVSVFRIALLTQQFNSVRLHLEKIYTPSFSLLTPP